MSDPFIGQISLFAFNFPPRGWAFCNGQLLQISQNTALFSLLGTTYGGDGRVTFGLPNLKGRIPIHAGRGPGLTERRLGAIGGVPTVTLTEQQMPSHTHLVTVNAVVKEGDSTDPSQRHPAYTEGRVEPYAAAANGSFAPDAVSVQPTGSNAEHNNHQPYLSMYFSIALMGIYPSRP